MADNALDAMASQLAKTRLGFGGGVSFEGKSLKLNNSVDAEEVVKQIEECGDLSFLNMAGNTLGVEAAEAIAKALEKHPEFKRALWKDMFTGRMKEEIPKALKHLGDGLVAAGAQLVELDLSDNAFGPIGVGGLAALLRSRPCYTLQELRLNNNGLGITGGKMLAEGLLQCHKNSQAEGKGLALKVFIAGRNRLENPGAMALAQVFKTLGTLREVVMPQNGIYHPGVKALSDAFKLNTDLEVLNLNDNTLTRKGAAALSEALPLLTKLRVLNLGDSLLKTKGSILIAEALTKHTQLEEVILSGNEMCLRGGLKVAQVLKGRPSLKIVDLNDNSFGKKGLAEIKAQLQSVLAVPSDDEDEDDDEDDEEEEEEDESDEDDEEEQVEGDEAEDEDDDEEYEDEDEEEVLEEDNVSGNIIPVRTASPTNSATTVPQFLEAPSAVRLIALSSIGEHVTVFRQYVESIPEDSFLDQILPLIMKVSALSTHNQDAAKPIALEASKALYGELFDWVDRNGPSVLTTVNNALLVHLGLIKSEDKKMKLFWNLEGCIIALNDVLTQTRLIPRSTRELLRFFLERPDCKVQLTRDTKEMILETLSA